MGRRNALLLMVVLGLAATSNTGCKGQDQTKVIRLGHALDRSHSVHQAMEFMAKRLRERSGGRLDLQIYPSGQLGSEREMIELLQLGGLGMTKVSAAVMEGFVSAYKIFSVPYLFEDKAHQFRVLDGEVGRGLLEAPRPVLLRGLAYYASGSRNFYTKDKPIETPEDLEGMKIRVMNSTTSIKMVRALGGSATPIPFGELYTALQQGVVDGAENNPPSFYLTRHYELCKFYAIDEHSSVPDILIIGTSTWDALNAAEQRWLQEAADESVIEQRKLWVQSENHALAEAQKAGVKISYPDKKAFQDKVKDLHVELAQDPEIAALMKAIAALR